MVCVHDRLQQADDWHWMSCFRLHLMSSFCCILVMLGSYFSDNECYHRELVALGHSEEAEVKSSGFSATLGVCCRCLGNFKLAFHCHEYFYLNLQEYTKVAFVKAVIFSTGLRLMFHSLVHKNRQRFQCFTGLPGQEYP